MAGLSALQEQAIRLMRTKWGANADLLASELFLILSQAADPLATGPVTTTPDGAQSSTAWPALPTLNLDLPNMDFPELGPDLPLLEDLPAPPGAPGGTRQKRQTIPQDRRVVVTGVVTEGTGSDYRVDLYPNGSRAVRDDGTPLTVNVAATCDQIDPAETIPPGTWVWVYRYTRVKAITTTTLAQLPSGPWVEVARSTQYKVARQSHDIVIPIWLDG